MCPGTEVVAVCDADPARARATGIPAWYDNYHDVLRHDDVDAVVIASPNHLHAEMAQAAAVSGKHILCEKPLALSLADAHAMLEAARRTGIVHMTAFTYQFTPAVRYLRELVRNGGLGTVRSVRAAYLMALSKHLLGWRSESRYAGSGVLADIGSHLIHLIRYVAGDFVRLTARKRKFREQASSDVEDWISFLAELESGACANVEISRICAGRGAGISEDMFIEVYGSAGSAVFSLQEPWTLQAALGEDGVDPDKPLKRIDVPPDWLKLPASPRAPDAHDRRWGYRYDQAFQFVESIRLNESRVPSLEDGVKCQAVMEAALGSCESGRWVEVKE